MRVLLAAFLVIGLASLSQWREVRPADPFTHPPPDDDLHPSLIRVRPIVDIAGARLLDRVLCQTEAVFPIRWLATMVLLECPGDLHVLEVTSPGRAPAVVILPVLPTRPPGWSSRALDVSESMLLDQALRLHFQGRSRLAPFRLTWAGCLSLRGEMIEIARDGLEVVVARGLLHPDLLPEVELAWSDIAARLKRAVRC